MTHLLLWARRFGRTAPRLRPAVSFGLVALFLFGINTFLDSQTVSPRTYAAATLGGYAAVYRFAEPVPYGDESASRLQDWSETSGTPVALVSMDFPVDALADDGLYYDERDWSRVEQTPFEAVAGRLPEAPGEVALAAPGSRGRAALLGQDVEALGGTTLRVVGLLEPAYDAREVLLAAPGTWARLGSVDAGLAQVSGEARLYLDRLDVGDTKALAGRAAAVMAGGSGTVPAGDELGSLRTAADVAEEAPQPWTSRSPILFVVPGMLLPGLVLLVLTSAQARRLVPASRTMVRVGVGAGRAVAAPLLPMLAWASAGGVLGAVAGSAVGILVSRVAPWGIARPSANVPGDAVVALVAGLLVGAVASWWFLRMRLGMGERRRRSRTRAVPRLARLRHLVALLLLGLVVHRALSLTRAVDTLVLVSLTVALSALLAPEVLLTLSRRLPARRLRDRLVGRLVAGYLPRAAAYTALVALGTGLATGVVVSVQSTVAAEEARQGSTAPPGVVALDGDDAPSLPVDPAVREAAEKVPALRDQRPVQLWSSGRLAEGQDGERDVTDMVTTADNAGVLFAAESVDDLGRLVGRPLTAAEEALVEDGGMLVTDPEAVVEAGHVRLAAMGSGEAVGVVPARRVRVRPAPWFVFVPGYVLTSTAERLGVPLTAGALVYTDVASADARSVLRSLAAAGINPEQAEIHRALPPVVPDVALVAWCVGFVLLLVGVSVVITRTQAESMRAWVGRLHLLGVERTWARGVLLRQHVLLTGTGLSLGLAAALGGLLLARVRMPEIPIEVPWTVLGSACAAVAVASVGALVSSLRVFTDLTGEAADAGE